MKEKWRKNLQFKQDFSLTTELRVDVRTKAQQHIMEETLRDLLSSAPEDATKQVYETAMQRYVLTPLKDEKSGLWLNQLAKRNAVKRIIDLFHPKSGFVTQPPPDPRNKEPSLKKKSS